MNYESMVDDLRGWDRMFGGGVPSRADIEAAMRGDVDAETLALMNRYSRERGRRTITKTVGRIYPNEWSLQEFEVEINKLIGGVPPDKRSAARVELKGGYDESTHLAVTYEREQTDEEWGLDVAHALMHARAQQTSDAEVYEKLRKKFGGGR